MIRSYVIALIGLCTLFSCTQGILVEEKWEWENHQWLQGDRKTMTIEATDTTTAYQMELTLRHQETYPFQNLYVRTLITFPSGLKDTSVVSMELMDDKGNWDGDYGENCCKIKFPLQRKFTFPETGKYTWSIEPYMRIDTIQGVNSIRVTCRTFKE